MSNNIPQLFLENFTSSGNLTSDTNSDIYSKKVDPNTFNGITFIMFFSKPCCKEEIKVFEDLNKRINEINSNRPIPLKFYLYEVSKGTNSAIISILEHAPYRIMGYPYVVTFFNGEFCSIYRPDALPEPDKLANEIVTYGYKITQKSLCNISM